MLALIVKKGTPITAVKHDGNGEYRHIRTVTQKDTMFIREDIVIDPRGNLTDESDDNGGPILLSILHGNVGVYGFRRLDFDTGKREPWTMLVDANAVETG